MSEDIHKWLSGSAFNAQASPKVTPAEPQGDAPRTEGCSVEDYPCLQRGCPRCEGIRLTRANVSGYEKGFKAGQLAEVLAIRAKYHGTDEWERPMVIVKYMDERVVELERPGRGGIAP